MRQLVSIVIALALLAQAALSFATNDRIIVYGGGGQGKVTFDGRLHASKGFRCTECHSDRFDTSRKATFVMDDHFKEVKCWSCHDGKKAFNDCESCHRQLAAPSAVPESVKINGAASVVTDLVAPYKDAVEKATGIKLVVDKSNAGKGLIDLIDGKCDAAMASASLDATVAGARSAGLSKPVPDLKMHVIKKSEVVFIVHPSNPVKALSWEQIKDIHTGKFTNWKEVGGKDLAITVYTDAKASATRGLIKQVVMGNSEYAASAKAVDFVKDVNDKVAVDESGIGGLGLGFVDTGKVSIVTTKKIERPLGFITVGAPSPRMERVMETFRAVSSK